MTPGQPCMHEHSLGVAMMVTLNVHTTGAVAPATLTSKTGPDPTMAATLTPVPRSLGPWPLEQPTRDQV